MTKDMECALIGKWRLIKADLWDRDYLDLVEPAQNIQKERVLE